MINSSFFIDKKNKYGIIIIGDSMQIDDKTILTYFKIKNNQDIDVEYVLYSKEPNTVYISNVNHTDDGFKFTKPNTDDLDTLKQIIKNLISINPNDFVFTRNKYQFITYGIFKDKKIIFEEYQKVQLTESQYTNLLTSRYLKYPYVNMTDLVDNELSIKNNNISMAISGVALLIFFGILIFNIPNFINIFYRKELICLFGASFNLQYLFEIEHVVPFFLFQMSVIILILSIISYYIEEKHPVIFYLSSVVLIFIISISYLNSLHLLKFSIITEKLFKIFIIYAIIHSIIVTITYYASKTVTLMITNYLKIKNFITHYAVFLTIFLFLLIGITLFYNYTLYNNVNSFIVNHVIGGNYYG